MSHHNELFGAESELFHASIVRKRVDLEISIVYVPLSHMKY